MRKIERKGEGNFLTDNALSILIAIIGIALIVFGLFKLYYAFIDDEYKNVGNTLDNIKGKADALKEGQENEFLIPGFIGLENWLLTGWNSNDSFRPDRCFFDSCICFCKIDKGYAYDPVQLKNACQDKGICKKINDYRIRVVNEQVTVVNSVSESNNRNFITFFNSTNIITIGKSDKEITVSGKVEKTEILLPDVKK